MELYSVSFSALGILVIVAITLVFLFIANRFLINKIQNTITRLIIAFVISIVLTGAGLALSVFLQLRR